MARRLREGRWRGRLAAALEALAEAEREFPLWLPVGLLGGIAAWFWLPDRAGWIGFIAVTAAVGLGMLATARVSRWGPALAWFALAAAFGCGLIWWTAERVAAPRSERAQAVEITGVVESVQPLAAERLTRIVVAGGGGAAGAGAGQYRRGAGAGGARTGRARPFPGVPDAALAAAEAEYVEFDELPGVSCSEDLCAAYVDREGRRWRILATRTRHIVAWPEMVRACAWVDIVISDRRLPRGCNPRWLRADRDLFARTGGLSIVFGQRPRVTTVIGEAGEHPWAGARRN